MKKNEDLIARLNKFGKGVDTVQSPIQKIVPIVEPQKSSEAQVMFWMDRRLKSAMQVAALSANSNLKVEFVQLAEQWCADRGIEWRQ